MSVALASDGQLGEEAEMDRWSLLVALIVSLLACGCGSDAGRVGGGFSQTAVGVPTTNLCDQCVSDFDPETGHFPDKVAVEQAANFFVSYHGHYKVLRTRLIAEEWSGSIDDVAVLVQLNPRHSSFAT